MILNFNVTGEKRKAMVAALEKELNTKAKYLGMPSAAYQVGDYTVTKNGALEFEKERIANYTSVIKACIEVTGEEPAEWKDKETTLVIEIPREQVNVENLTSLLEAKGELIKKALQVDNLNFEIFNNRVSFPWFTNANDKDAATYTKFIAAICDMTKKQKRITAKPKENENEKYAFRCFLLRLGFIGDEFKSDRKVLLQYLDGSSAFKCAERKEEQ